MNSKVLAIFATLLAVSVGSKFGNHRVAPRFVEVSSGRDAVPVDFECPGPGSFRFPDESKCGSFISCTDQLEAFEVACPDGLHYVIASGPQESLCDSPDVAKCNEGVTPSTTTTTTPRPTGPVQPGDPCNPDQCTEVGYCKDYFICNKETGKYDEPRQCGKNLWWNSAAGNGPDGSTIHGGTCDFFGNLPASLQQAYTADEKCVCPCDWFQEAEQYCTGKYMYRKPFDNYTANEKDREVELQCPSGLVWLGKPKLTCGRCNDAINLDGNPCCVEKEEGKRSGAVLGQVHDFWSGY